MRESERECPRRNKGGANQAGATGRLQAYHNLVRSQFARPDPSNPILGCLGLESFNNLDINQDPRDQQDERCMGITLVLFLFPCIQLHMGDYMG